MPATARLLEGAGTQPSALLLSSRPRVSARKTSRPTQLRGQPSQGPRSSELGISREDGGGRRRVTLGTPLLASFVRTAGAALILPFS